MEITAFYSHVFVGKNFVKVTHLLNESLKSWFDGKKISESKCFVFSQCDSLLCDPTLKFFVKLIYWKVLYWMNWFHGKNAKIIGSEFSFCYIQCCKEKNQTCQFQSKKMVNQFHVKLQLPLEVGLHSEGTVFDI